MFIISVKVVFIKFILRSKKINTALRCKDHNLFVDRAAVCVHMQTNWWQKLSNTQSDG